jgi:protein O-mannosyl-transferase
LPGCRACSLNGRRRGPLADFFPAPDVANRKPSASGGARQKSSAAPANLPGTARPSAFHLWLPAAVLFAAVWVVFGPALKNGFINYDDPVYVTKNPHMAEGLTFSNLLWAFTDTRQAFFWHPVTWLSHLLDAELFGLSPAGHHFTSVLFHALNTALLFVVLNAYTAARGRSFAVAALFGVHPLRVESIAWACERKDVLSGFFFLLTLWAYWRYAREPQVRQGPPGKRRLFYLLSLGLFALGLMSKPMVVTLPFVLLLLDYWPLNRIQSWNPRALPLVEKLPFFALTLAVIPVTIMTQRGGGAFTFRVPFPARLLNALVSYWRYIEKHFYPVGLAPEYPYTRQWPLLQIALAALVVLGLTVAAVLLARRCRWLGVGWCWYLGTLVPVIGLMQSGGQSMADRFSYLPCIGLFIMVVWTVGAWAPRWLQLSLLLGSLLACGAISQHQLGYWKDSGTLFMHTLAVTENNDIAYTRVASFLMEQGESEKALQYFEKALAIEPRYEEAQLARGALLLKSGRREEALAGFQQAVQLLPHSAMAHYDLGLVLAGNNRLDEAGEQLDLALKLKPDFAEAYLVLGDVFVKRGNRPEALRHYQKALQLNPGFTIAEKHIKDLQ